MTFVPKSKIGSSLHHKYILVPTLTDPLSFRNCDKTYHGWGQPDNLKTMPPETSAAEALKNISIKGNNLFLLTKCLCERQVKANGRWKQILHKSKVSSVGAEGGMMLGDLRRW